MVLGKLSLLYTYLVWESSVLLTLCTPNLTDDEKIDFAREDLNKLIPKDMKGELNAEYLYFSCFYLPFFIIHSFVTIRLVDAR